MDKKGDLKINTTGNKVFSGDEEIYLTETEYEILSLMFEIQGKNFSVQNIYESVWQEPFSIILQIQSFEVCRQDKRNPVGYGNLSGRVFLFHYECSGK